MPSPIGHALAGLSAGWLVAGAPSGPQLVAGAADFRRRDWRQVCGRTATVTSVAYLCLGVAPDLDLLVGAHSRQTHSLGAAALATLVAFLATRRSMTALGAGAAWASHILLDWLGTDGSAPIGIMALWPLSDGFYESSLHVFMAIDRRWWMEHFVSHNLTAIAREIAILLPVLTIVWIARRRAQPPATPGPTANR